MRDGVAPPGGYEDVLRTLGAVLDASHARSVRIRQVGRELQVCAIVAYSLDDLLTGTWTTIDHTFSVDAMAEEQRTAVARRGSRHLAGPIERSLRLVGQQADERSLTGLTLMQHHTDAGWMVWHDANSDGRPRMLALTSGELGTLEARPVPHQAGAQCRRSTCRSRPVPPGAPQVCEA